jgi:hypothetical protein
MVKFAYIGTSQPHSKQNSHLVTSLCKADYMDSTRHIQEYI